MFVLTVTRGELVQADAANLLSLGSRLMLRTWEWNVIRLLTVSGEVREAKEDMNKLSACG